MLLTMVGLNPSTIAHWAATSDSRNKFLQILRTHLL